MTIDSKVLALAVSLALAACSGEPNGSNRDGGGGTGGVGGSGGTDAPGGSGGSGGSGGTGGTGGSEGGSGGTVEDVSSCLDLDLPGSIDEGAWSAGFSIAGLSGQDGVTPSAMGLATGSDGSLIATGYFSWSGTEPLPPAAVLRDGDWKPLQTEWNLDLPPGGFSSVAVRDDGATAFATFAAGGLVGWGPPTERNTEVWVDQGAGLESIARIKGLVRDLLWYQDELWIAGPFELETGESSGIAIWDGSAWRAPAGGAPDGPVYTMRRDGASLLVGGLFDSIGGIESPRVAEFDGTGWIAHGMEWDATVYALLRKDGILYAGGLIIPDFEVPQGGIAQKVGGSWELLDGGLNVGWYAGTVSDLAVFQDDLYISGCFKSVGSDELAASNLVRRTAAGWESFTDPKKDGGSVWVNPLSCGDMGPYSLWDMQFQRLLVDGERLLLAGSFSGLGDAASQSVIAFDGEDFHPIGGGGHGLTGDPGKLAIGGPDCSTYALGRTTTHAGGSFSGGGVIQFGEDGWIARSGRRPAGHECEHIVVDGEGTIYVGCTQENEWPEPPKPRIFVVDESGWQPVGEPNDIEGMIFDMAIDRQDRIWIAGGAERGFVMRFDGEGYTAIGNTFDAPVFRIAVAPTTPSEPVRAVASGFFEHLGIIELPGIAHFDGSDWEPLPQLPSTVMALAYGKNDIFLSTGFEGDDTRPILARLEDGAWVELATPANGLPAPEGESTHTFTSLLARGDLLIAAGYVWPEEGGRNVFLWDGESFTSIGGGLSAISVDSIGIASDGLWFSGAIAEAGLKGSRIPTVGVGQFVWPSPMR